MRNRRTDLALEARELWQESAEERTQLEGVEAREEMREGIPVTRVSILDRRGEEALGKPVGTYVTLTLDGLARREENAFGRAARAVAAELGELLGFLHPEAPVLVVGLGNPGSKYESTRHNMGFLAVDGLARRKGFRFNKLRFRAWTAEWMVNGEKVLVMKPQTYMNLSGESVGEAARFYKIPADHVVVISDDISLPVGKLRIRTGGSAGGHNGLKNIIQHLGTDQFPRIKVGVGAPGQAGYDVVDWVIGRPLGEDQKVLMEALDRAGDAAEVLISQGPDRAMNRFN